MSALTRILSGLALAGALSVPTFAATGPQQGDSLPNGSMLIIWPDGTLARVHIIDSAQLTRRCSKPRKPLSQQW